MCLLASLPLQCSLSHCTYVRFGLQYSTLRYLTARPSPTDTITHAHSCYAAIFFCIALKISDPLKLCLIFRNLWVKWSREKRTPDPRQDSEGCQALWTLKAASVPVCPGWRTNQRLCWRRKKSDMPLMDRQLSQLQQDGLYIKIQDFASRLL